MTFWTLCSSSSSFSEPFEFDDYMDYSGCPEGSGLTLFLLFLMSLDLPLRRALTLRVSLLAVFLIQEGEGMLTFIYQTKYQQLSNLQRLFHKDCNRHKTILTMQKESCRQFSLRPLNSIKNQVHQLSIIIRMAPKTKPKQESDREDSRSRSRDRKNKLKDTKTVGRPSKKIVKKKREETVEEPFSEDGISVENLDDLPVSNEGLSDSCLTVLFIDFFNSIHEEKGLVLPESERAILIKKTAKQSKQPKIKWTPKHEWHEDIEKAKILSIGNTFGLDLEQSSHSWLKKLLFESSFIFAQEFTEEIYKVILNIDQIRKGKPTLEERNHSNFKEQMIQQERPSALDLQDQTTVERRLAELASEMCDNPHGNYGLISFQFRSNPKKPKKRQQEESESQEEIQRVDRKSAYLELVKAIKQTLIKTERASQQ